VNGAPVEEIAPQLAEDALHMVIFKVKVVLMDLPKDLNDGFARLLRLKLLTDQRGWNGLVLSSISHNSFGWAKRTMDSRTGGSDVRTPSSFILPASSMRATCRRGWSVTR